MEKNGQIGVALAGGGLQGFSHIGALRALEELGVKIDYISGTSTGSLFASLYAMGFTTDEMEEIMKEKYQKIIRFSKKAIVKAMVNYLRIKETRTEGLIDGKVVEKLMNDEAIKKDIYKIADVKKRNLAIATVDTKTMKECIFTSRRPACEDESFYYIEDITIGKAVQASMAFPGIFTPVNYDNYNFIDGGTVDNLPVKPLRDMGAKKIIAIAFDLSDYKITNNLENVVLRALDIFSSADVKEAEKMSDVAIEILNRETGLLKMDKMEDTVKHGYQAVMDKKEEILSLLTNDLSNPIEKIS